MKISFWSIFIICLFLLSCGTSENSDSSIQDSGTSESESLTKAKRYYKEKNYTKSVYYYKQYLKDNPNDNEAIYGIGLGQFKLEKYKDAIPNLEKAYQANPQDYKLKYYLARSMQKSENGVNKKILELYEESAKNGVSEAVWELGEIYRYNKYNSRAIAQYTQYQSMGGTLNREVKNWLEKQGQLVSNETKTEKSTPSDTTEVVKKTAPEALMVCPLCGRLGEKGTDICLFDSEPLQPLE